MISIKNLSVSFGEKNILSHFNFSAKKGEIIGIKGDSGIGKTTFLNFLMNIGIENAEISYDEKKINGKISCVFQESRLLENVSVKNNIFLPLKNIYSKKDALEITKNNLSLVSMLDKISSKCKNLSGGEKQRVALARGFAFPSEILLLDEAFNSLNEELKFEIMEDYKKQLKSDENSSRTVILISHNSLELEYFCDRIFEFK